MPKYKLAYSTWSYLMRYLIITVVSTKMRIKPIVEQIFRILAHIGPICHKLKKICPICHKRRLSIILELITRSGNKATSVNECHRSRAIRSRFRNIFHGSLIEQSSLATTTTTTGTIIIAKWEFRSIHVLQHFSILSTIPPTLSVFEFVSQRKC